MSFGSQKLVHTDGTMHHLGIDAVTPRVILVPDPQEVPLYAALLENPVQQGCYREYATWRGIWRGEPLTVMSCGFGCMPMAIAVEELHHLGAESLIKLAAWPAIQPELEPGTLLAASGAVRGEGATREYIDPSYPAVADMPLLGALLSCGVPDAGLFRSHDCTSLETPWAPGGPARIARWAELGVSALDGETSALFVLASTMQPVQPPRWTHRRAGGCSRLRRRHCDAADPRGNAPRFRNRNDHAGRRPHPGRPLCGDRVPSGG